MVKIFKYQMKLEDGPQTFLMPISARVVAVQDQYNVVCFWALCNPEEKQTERNFHIFYQMLEGLGEGKLKDLGLKKHAATYHYLNQGGPQAVSR